MTNYNNPAPNEYSPEILTTKAIGEGMDSVSLE